jgi:FixJ family two-component response regulator
MEVSGSVFLVGDEPNVRDEMAEGLRALGWQVHAYGRVAEYLEHAPPRATGCVVLLDSLNSEGHRQLQEHQRRGHSLQPVIYVPEHFDVAATIENFREFAFLLRESSERTQPSSAVPDSGWPESQRPRSAEGRLPSDELLEKTSALERRVIELISAGYSNKQLIQELGMRLRSLQRLKAALYRRLQIESPADLVRVNERLARLPPPPA